jgi:hypothetical protein
VTAASALDFFLSQTAGYRRHSFALFLSHLKAWALFCDV